MVYTHFDLSMKILGNYAGNAGFCKLWAADNVKICENILIIQKYFRTPWKWSKKCSYPMKMLQNILVPPLIHSTPVPSIKNDRSLSSSRKILLWISTKVNKARGNKAVISYMPLWQTMCLPYTQNIQFLYHIRSNFYVIFCSCSKTQNVSSSECKSTLRIRNMRTIVR